MSDSTKKLCSAADLLDRPQDDDKAVGDPYKTLFISRLVSVALILARS